MKALFFLLNGSTDYKFICSIRDSDVQPIDDMIPLHYGSFVVGEADELVDEDVFSTDFYLTSHDRTIYPTGLGVWFTEHKPTTSTP